MIGDVDISGVFLPTLLAVLMGITYVLYLLVHGLLLMRLHALSGLAPGIVQRGSLRFAARLWTHQSIPDDMKNLF